MNIPHTIQSLRKKPYIYGIIFLFISFSIILTNLLYIKIYPFQKNFFIIFSLNTSSSSTKFTSTSTVTTATISTTVTTITMSTIVTTITTTMSTTVITSAISTTDINELLCNNLSDYYPLNTSHHPCEKVRCAILIHKNDGRLGNQMFLFASGYGLARAHGCGLHATQPIFQELSDNFNMSIKKDMWLSKEQINNMKDFIIKKTVCSFLPNMLRPNAFKHLELSGYWQSYLYFDAYRDEIREIYSARSETLSRLSNYFFNITKNDCPTCLIPSHISHNELRQIIRINYNITWIGIHIRLTDFRVLGYSSNEDYINRAIAYYKRRYYNHKIRFLIASDEKSYCEKFLNQQNSSQIFLLPNYFSQADDLMALSFCHHSIITGGTYGFWAGYLAGGEVIHDIIYKAECSRSDYYPPWFKLVGETKQAKS